MIRYGITVEDEDEASLAGPGLSSTDGLRGKVVPLVAG